MCFSFPPDQMLKLVACGSFVFLVLVMFLIGANASR